ncbi:hypothetical protein VH567_03145 [Sphingomonas sp. 4RDLI-65]|uniref:hypothetical protein n=1 Tax=Sphingomonas sp. 4RDLI-65 TaxID=3111641 RepID=UPI003C1BB83B
MTTKIMMGFAAAAALVSTQAVAAPVAPTNSALSLSTAKSVRSGTSAQRKNKLAGTGAIVVGVLAAGAVVGAIIAISNDDDSDSN